MLAAERIEDVSRTRMTIARAERMPEFSCGVMMKRDTELIGRLQGFGVNRANLLQIFAGVPENRYIRCRSAIISLQDNVLPVGWNRSKL